MTRRWQKLHNFEAESGLEPGPCSGAESGSAVADFVMAAAGGLLLTLATLGLVFSGFMRTRAMDALGTATRYAALADADLAAGQQVVAQSLEEELATWPLKVKLVGVDVSPWSPVLPNGRLATCGGLQAIARYSSPWLGLFGITETVKAHAASESN